jgi:simple sugar transport system permease protein
VGWSNGVIVVRASVPSIVATIGTQFFWRGVVMLLSAGLAIDLSGLSGTALHACFAGRIAGLVPVQSLWALFIAVAAWLLLDRHVFGDAVRFTGDNAETALKMGVAVGRTRIAVFSLMGFLCALAGIMVCVEMGSWWPTQGEGYLMLVFASVFIGGTSVFGGQGSVYGTCIGAVIIGIIEAGIISAGLSGFWTRTVYGVIIVASVSLNVAMAKPRRRPQSP